MKKKTDFFEKMLENDWECWLEAPVKFWCNLETLKNVEFCSFAKLQKKTVKLYWNFFLKVIGNVG